MLCMMSSYEDIRHESMSKLATDLFVYLHSTHAVIIIDKKSTDVIHKSLPSFLSLHSPHLSLPIPCCLSYAFMLIRPTLDALYTQK